MSKSVRAERSGRVAQVTILTGGDMVACFPADGNCRCRESTVVTTLAATCSACVIKRCSQETVCGRVAYIAISLRGDMGCPRLARDGGSCIGSGAVGECTVVTSFAALGNGLALMGKYGCRFKITGHVTNVAVII